MELIPRITSFIFFSTSRSCCISFFISLEASIVFCDSSTMDISSWLLAPISSIISPAAAETWLMDSVKPSCTFTTSDILSPVTVEASTTVVEIPLIPSLISDIFSELLRRARSKALIFMTESNTLFTIDLNLFLPVVSLL